jgi:sugar-specific transcriptional regulator TrmB
MSEEDVRTLVKLGLTPNQAKLYLAHLKIGKANGRTLAKHSNLARQEVYQLLSDLQEIGLVEKVIKSPSEFNPVPIQAGLSVLLVKRKREYREIEEETKTLLEKFKSIQKETFAEGGNGFLLIPGTIMFFEKRKKMLANVKQNLRVITTEKRLAQTMHYLLRDYKKALKKGVKIRIITEKFGDEESFLKTVHSLMTKPNFSLRYVTPPIKASVVIFDDKEAFVIVYPKLDLVKSPALWTNHTGLISMYQDHFETMWASALEYTFQGVGMA